VEPMDSFKFLLQNCFGVMGFDPDTSPPGYAFSLVLNRMNHHIYLKLNMD
jgi:hypothetical protein